MTLVARAPQGGCPRSAAGFLDIADGCSERSPDELVELAATRLAETARREQVHVCADLLCTCSITDTGGR